MKPKSLTSNTVDTNIKDVELKEVSEAIPLLTNKVPVMSLQELKLMELLSNSNQSSKSNILRT